jgi:hypothetical protein
MGEKCSAYWGRGETYTWFWWRNLRERDHLEDPGVDGGDNIKMNLQEVECGSIHWIDLAQDMDRRRALVNAVMNLGFHKMRGIS